MPGTFHCKGLDASGTAQRRPEDEQEWRAWKEAHEQTEEKQPHCKLVPLGVDWKRLTKQFTAGKKRLRTLVGVLRQGFTM